VGWGVAAIRGGGRVQDERRGLERRSDAFEFDISDEADSGGNAQRVVGGRDAQRQLVRFGAWWMRRGQVGRASDTARINSQ